MAGCWGGLCRPGEILASRRADLVLPSDVGCTLDHILLAIREPKTRYKAARHQVARVDQPDLMDAVTLAFKMLEPHEPLWTMSGSTIRQRFAKLLEAVGLNSHTTRDVGGLDLASLRAGGATWMMEVSEDPDLVRRRGRWLTNRIMEVYVQQITAILYLPRLPEDLRFSILDIAKGFRSAVIQAGALQHFCIPCHLWYNIFSCGLALARK